MSTAALLTDFENCDRKGWFSRSWQAQKLRSSQMTLEAVKVALRSTEQQDGAFGEIAGTAVLQLAQDRGMETNTLRVYDSATHHACLADLIVSAVRKPSDPPWLIPPPVQNWTPECLMAPDGNSLRRLVLVSNWSDARHYSECRAWRTLGEVAHYELPMSLIVCVIGQERDGLRSGPWTQGFLHPSGNHQLRFRKKSRSTSEVFNDKWEKIHREDHAEISRETWLEAMLKDDVLHEVCFRVDIPVPPIPHLQRIRDMASRKLERLYTLKEKPEPNLSSCDWPVPCQFRRLCHVLPEREPSENLGFLSVPEVLIEHVNCPSTTDNRTLACEDVAS